MNRQRKTAIVTGASQGIGAGIVNAFVERGFNVVANSRKLTQSTEVAASEHVALVDGHIGEPATAAKIVETALSRFELDRRRWSIMPASSSPSRSRTTRPRTSSRSSRRMSRASCTSPSSPSSRCWRRRPAAASSRSRQPWRNPIRGVTASVPMITKGGLETITQHLAMEYAKDGIRVNAVAPGVVYTPMHRNTPKDFMQSLSPMGQPSTVKEIVDAVHVPDRRRHGHGSHSVRRWRRAFRPLVIERRRD